MQEIENPEQFRKKALIWGTGVACALVVLVLLYVPAPPPPQITQIPLNTPAAAQNPLGATPNLGAASGLQTAGAEIYGKFCAQCHGKEGKSDTQMAKMMKKAPTNLVLGPFQLPRTVEAISELVQKGNGGSMPGFGAELGESGARSVAEFVLSLEKK